MQIKLFPDASPPLEAHIAIQRGRIGPIRFAATPMSYPHLCEILASLVRSDEMLTNAETED